MANPIGLIVAGTIAVVGAVSYGIYERYKKNQLAKEKQDLIVRQQQLKTREEKLHQLETEQLKLKLAKNQSELAELKKNYDELATKVQCQDKIIKKLKNPKTQCKPNKFYQTAGPCLFK